MIQAPLERCVKTSVVSTARIRGHVTISPEPAWADVETAGSGQSARKVSRFLFCRMHAYLLFFVMINCLIIHICKNVKHQSMERIAKTLVDIV